MCRESNDHLKKLEEEKLKPIPVQDIQLDNSPKPVMDTHLEPKPLDFNTPQSRKRCSGSFMGTLSTPATPLNSDLGRCRDQPRKELMEPNMDDYPVDATEEEQRRYIRKKNTERWCYNKLAGADAANYRQAELNRVKSYNPKKKNTQDVDESSQDTDTECQKKLSRERQKYT